MFVVAALSASLLQTWHKKSIAAAALWGKSWRNSIKNVNTLQKRFSFSLNQHFMTFVWHNLRDFLALYLKVFPFLNWNYHSGLQHSWTRLFLHFFFPTASWSDNLTPAPYAKAHQDLHTALFVENELWVQWTTHPQKWWHHSWAKLSKTMNGAKNVTGHQNIFQNSQTKPKDKYRVCLKEVWNLAIYLHNMARKYFYLSNLYEISHTNHQLQSTTTTKV